MSSHDNRYDKSDSWKSHRHESSRSRDSPDRYRNRNDSKHYSNYKDRRYYDNRSWRDSSYTKRYSYDTNRYRYERRTETSDDKATHHEGEKSEAAPTTDRETTHFVSKKRWNSDLSSPPKPTRPPWLLEQRPLETAYDSQPSPQPASSFKFIFNHINDVYSQNNATQPDRQMSFIDRLIADEAMRMLAAASSDETTALNEPCEATEAAAANKESAASEVAGTSSLQDTTKEGIDATTASKVASVTAADSKLLQKSAEQVTKKLINQLSTMSKYDLKHMIDNPAGKYETALNRHAQNKLRAEVRKQLKSFQLNELGSSCVTGDGIVESDEAIDADKIPSELLEQIEQALDLNFFDLTQPEVKKPNVDQVSDGVVASPKPNDELVESIQSAEQAEVGNKTAVNQSPKVVDVSSSPTTTSTKNGNDSKPSSSSQSYKKKIITRKPADTMNRSKGRVLLPVLKNSVILRKATIPSPVPSVSNVRPNASTTSKDTDTNEKLNSVENTIPTPLDTNSSPRNASFLRVSTVEELNRRLDGIHGAQSGDNSPSVQDPPNITPERILPNDGNSNSSEQSTIQNPAPDVTTSERKDTSVPRQNYKTVNISTLKVIGRSNITKEALLDYINNKKDGKRLQSYQRSGGSGELGNVSKQQTAIPRFGDDQSRKHVPQTVPGTRSLVQPFLARKRSSPKKRKFPKTNVPAPDGSVSQPSGNDIAPSTTQDGNTGEGFEKRDTSFPPAAKKAKQRKKKSKANRSKPLGSTEHSYSAVNMSQPRPEESVVATELPEDICTFSSSGDEFFKDIETNKGEPQAIPKAHIKIVNVRSILESTERDHSAMNDATGTGEPGTQQLPQDMSPMEPIVSDTPRTSEDAEQNVQNTVASANGMESNHPDWNLMNEPVADTKEEIVRIDSQPEPPVDKLTEEYILGGDSVERSVDDFLQADPSDGNATNDRHNRSNDSASPLPSSNTVSLQSLCAITEHMQSIETQTMELYNRKMQIDAMFMTLHAERMDIDQQLERLHNIRSEQINFMRQNLLELTASSNGSGGSTMQDEQFFAATVSPTSSNGIATTQSVNKPGQTSNSSSSSPQVGARQQERTIRRITPIGSNSVLMKIFQRRRVPSERSTEENSSCVDPA